MGLLASVFSSDQISSIGFSSGLGMIGGGPSGWTSGFGGGFWSGLGGRTSFEVGLTGVFGGAPGDSLAERASAAEQAGDVIVMGPSSRGDGTGVTVHDLNDGTIVDIWDGGGNDWQLLERPAPTEWDVPDFTPVEPLPPPVWAGLDSGYDSASYVDPWQNTYDPRTGFYAHAEMISV